MSNIVTITSNDTLEVAYTKKLTVLLHTLKKTTVKIPYVDCWLCEHCLEQGDDCNGGTQALYANKVFFCCYHIDEGLSEV